MSELSASLDQEMFWLCQYHFPWCFLCCTTLNFHISFLKLNTIFNQISTVISTGTLVMHLVYKIETFITFKKNKITVRLKIPFSSSLRISSCTSIKRGFRRDTCLKYSMWKMAPLWRNCFVYGSSYTERCQWCPVLCEESYKGPVALTSHWRAQNGTQVQLLSEISVVNWCGVGSLHRLNFTFLVYCT